MSKEDGKQYIADLTKKYGTNSTDAVRQLYDEWAKKYDVHLSDLGYVAPINAAKYHAQNGANLAGLLLDVGCGTGLVGTYLHALGFSQLHGIDLSQEMLDEANVAGHYDLLETADLTQSLTLPSNTYDSAICVGVLGPRVGATPLLSEVLRVLKPNGLFTVAIRDAWYDGVLAQAVAETADCELVESVIDAYFIEDEVNGRFLTVRKTV